MNIVFWNTSRNKINIADCLKEIIIENNVDVLVLAEYSNCINELCSLINSFSNVQYKTMPNIGGCGYIKGIINCTYETESLFEESRYQIVKITTLSYELLIAMIHNVSKLNYSDETQKILLTRFHCDIISEEDKHICKNTLVIGDFNMNPFEIGCISAGGMYAVPFKEEVVNKFNSVIQGEFYPKFYNPTWKFFGNKSTPYTTYYYNNGGDTVNYYWHIFDQVLIRPRLIKAFDEDMLKIITGTQNHLLLKNGKPAKNDYSDHLPLLCVLKDEYL